jgi:hypothetical protein
LSTQEENEYIHKILNTLITILTNTCLAQTDELISTLESLNGRKNPSAQQTKLLKKSIPYVNVLKALMTSQTFRGKILDEKFFQKFGKLIQLSKPINNGELNLDSVCGNGSQSDYINGILSMIEHFSQNKEILENNLKQVIYFNKHDLY